MPRLESVQVGRPRQYPRPDFATPGHYWRTAFFKTPVSGRVMVRRLNVDGDRQSDLRVHGGPDQAILAYSGDHYAAWREELGLREMGPGGFGENFTVAGQTELDACLGDVYRIGGAVVQVSCPRGPCFKISYRWNRADLLDRVTRNGRHGWYLRVLEEGEVGAGDELVLLDRPQPGWTVRRMADTIRFRKHDREAARELAEVPELAAADRRALLAAVNR